MSNQSEAVKRWRKNAKARLIKTFGGSCCICGYNKSDAALEFHHLDPNQKDTTWGAFRGSIKGWDSILEEMRKCVMVCSNCHKEVHAGDAIIPQNAKRLDEDLAKYKEYEKAEYYDQCPICLGRKTVKAKTCSSLCAGKLKKTNRYEGHDLKLLYKQHKSYESVGRLFGVTGAAIKKQLKKCL
jgi:hypothetical protein